MEDLFGINAHRQAVQENIEKAFDLGFDADNNIEGIEKAKHQVGDIHPNGRWVWTEWAPGKFDWKSLKGKHHKGSQQTTTQQQITDDKEVASFMDKVKTFSNKYNDSSKISVSKTPKGNWDVSYDGHRLGIINADQLSEKAAKKQGWLKEENKSAKLSAFLDKTFENIKDYVYGKFDDDRLKNAEKILTKNESLAKKFMSAAFPAANDSALFPAEKEIPISDDESIILSAYKTTDTTSRDPLYRGSTKYYYEVHHKVGNNKKLLYSDSYSRAFSYKYGGTSSDIKNKCKINALVKYFHI